MFKLEFSYDAAGPVGMEEGRAIVAAMVGMFGKDVLPPELSVAHTIGDISIKVAGGPEAVTKYIAASEKAPDGWPTPADPAAVFGGAAAPAPEPDPAAVFGGTAPDVTPPPVAAGPVDADGIPWDERIHASTKTQTAKNTWTRRRNTPDAVYDAVYAELKAGAAPPPPTAATTAAAPPPPGANVTAPTPGVAGSFADAMTIAAMTAEGFPQIMAKITKAQNAKLITPEQVNEWVTTAGGPSPKVLSLLQHPDIIATFDALLVDHLTSEAG